MNLTMEEKALRFAALFLTALTIVTCASLRYLPLLRTREQEKRTDQHKASRGCDGQQCDGQL